MITIIFAHPWHGSFNKVILDHITDKLDRDNRPYQVIDLNKDKFNPAMTEEDLALYNQGKANDPFITKYQNIIKLSDKIIFIFPIWWNTMPAILKGFFDKVLLKDFAFNYEGGFNGLLRIDKSLIITTSESPTHLFNSAIKDNFIKDMLFAVGVKTAEWINCESTSKGTDEHRIKFIEKVIKEISLL